MEEASEYCRCSPNDGKFRMSINDGKILLIHGRCKKPLAEEEHYFEMEEMPVTVDYRTRCGIVHPDCDCDGWFEIIPGQFKELEVRGSEDAEEVG